MLRLTLPIVALWIGAPAGAASVSADGWKLPPLDGNMEGDFNADLLPGAPALHWSVTMNVPRPRERAVGFAINGPGLRVVGEALLDPKGDGAWKLTEAQVDLAVWWPILAPKYFPAQAGMKVAGSAVLAGDGSVTGGQVSARLEIDVREGSAADPAAQWSLAGVSMRGTLGRLPELAFDEPVRLRFGEATVAGIVLRDGAIDFTIAGDGAARVTAAECGVLGGRIGLAPFAVGGAERRVRTTLDFSSIDLGGLGKFLPSALSGASGLVSGKMEVGWEVGRGLTLATGSLRPSEATAASIKLAPTPGFLTERLPPNMRERFVLLPEWFGPIQKLFAPANPAYPILRAIEMGESSLDIATLEIGLNLDGDVRGRSAHVVAMTRPTVKGTAVDSVRFEFNVTGPLADLVRLLAEGRVNFHLR